MKRCRTLLTVMALAASITTVLSGCVETIADPPTSQPATPPETPITKTLAPIHPTPTRLVDKTDFSRIPGTSEPKCVSVNNNIDVRSGGFVSGNFSIVNEQFKADGNNRIKLYWIPKHSASITGLTVRVSRISDGMTAPTFHTDQAAKTNGFHFYPSLIKIPAPGTWRLEASAGPDRGCFIVDIHAN